MQPTLSGRANYTEQLLYRKRRFTTLFRACLCALCILISCDSSAPKRFDGEDVTIATFNIQWLGDGVRDRKKRTEDDYSRIARAIAITDADILGLQEIENSAALERVLRYLPEYDYIIGEGGRSQNVAVIFRKGVMVEKLEDYTPLAIRKGRDRPGLIVRCAAGEFDFLIMVVHFKATSRYDSTAELKALSRKTRERQAAAARQWARDVFADSKERDLLIIGDLNDYPHNRRNPTLSPLLADSTLRAVSANFRSCKKKSWKSIDHIVASASALNRLQTGSVAIVNLYDGFTRRQASAISDHCPVIARFEARTPDND